MPFHQPARNMPDSRRHVPDRSGHAYSRTTGKPRRPIRWLFKSKEIVRVEDTASPSGFKNVVAKVGKVFKRLAGPKIHRPQGG